MVGGAALVRPLQKKGLEVGERVVMRGYRRRWLEGGKGGGGKAETRG